MTIDVYSSTGDKKSSMALPEVLFAAAVNHGLMHQALMRQQSNRRHPIAHAKNRHEVAGSTRKLYGQKHTGQARRGSIRSPLLRGGGKAFGPRSDQNFQKDMPRTMRRAALASCLSLQAENKAILGLESYGSDIKTKTFVNLLKKLPVELGRRILIVLPEKHDALAFSARNVPNVKTLLVSYLNPEDILRAKSIVFVGDSVEKAVAIFAPGAVDAPSPAKASKTAKRAEAKVAAASAEPKAKKTTAKKTATKKPAAKKATSKKSSK